MCGRCRLGATGGCVVSIRRFGFRHHDAAFICVSAIQTSKVYLIKNKKSNQWSSICSKLVSLIF